MKKNILVIILAAVIIVVAGGSFYGGMLYKGSQTPARRTGIGSANSARFAAGASFSSGSVASIDSQSITLKLPTGGSRIIFYSATTEVGKFVSGTVSDLQVGDNVMVNGKTNTDGSITAQSIQIRPAGQAGPGQQGAPQ